MSALRRERRHVETSEFHEFTRRIIRAYAARVAAQDIEALAGLAQIHREVEDAMRLAVANLHGDPQAGRYSWTDIGRVLGVSRQAARQRFAGDVE